MTTDKPVFVRGLSRSGGTFLCTMLDAHPELAISYELYPNIIVLEMDQDSARTALIEFVKAIESHRNWKSIPEEVYPGPKYKVFCIRLERGGLSLDESLSLFKQALSNNMSMTTLDDGFEFVRMCCTLKMQKEGKLHWGAKMNNNIEGYVTRWPSVKCIDIVRDGRDVAASQIDLGTFGKTAAEVATSWKQTHSRFIRNQKIYPDNIMIIRYEDLIYETEKYARKMCDFMEIEYDRRMVNYEKESLTLFDAKHMSRGKIMKGVNDSSVGKWKRILDDAQVKEFSSVAGDMLAQFDYL